MARSDKLELEGTVTKVLPGTKFQVEVEMGKEKMHTIDCTISGKLRQNYIKVLLGDKVTVEVSPYDLSKGIIVYRNK